MVTIRIPSAVLHVPNERIMPVDQIERTIGRKLHIHRPEIWVRTFDQIVPKLALISGPIVHHRMLLGPEESDGVVD